MNKLNIELTNCFGIDSLNHEFDFGKGNTFSIYARNGLMKTSFAKTFQLIQQGKKENISDAIFGEPGCKFCSNGTPILKSAVHSF